MTTRKVRREPGYLGRRRDHQRHRATKSYIVAFVIALAVIAVVLGSLSLDRQAPLREPTREPTVTPMEASMGFLDAFASFDAERTQGYLAQDADVTELVRHVSSQLEGTPADLPMVLSLLRAQKYEASLYTWDVTSTPEGTKVRCWVRWNLLRSGDLGPGPYRGVYIFTVQDGMVVRARSRYSTRRFSREVWEPFDRWVTTRHPSQADVMYANPSHTEGAATERSITLWDRYVDEYVRSLQAPSPWTW